MANLPIRRGGSSVVPSSQEWAFDPFMPMRELMRWEPFAEMARSFQRPTATFIPAFEVKETKDSYIFKADVPGVNEKDLDVTLVGNRLTIAGRREAEQQDKSESYFTYERTYGSFMRTFTLPEVIDPDQVRAELKEGVLTLTVPKVEEAQPKRISVKASSEKVKA